MFRVYNITIQICARQRKYTVRNFRFPVTTAFFSYLFPLTAKPIASPSASDSDSFVPPSSFGIFPSVFPQWKQMEKNLKNVSG